jgi:MFS family permease
MMGAYTFCVGAFPVLLPEVGVALALANWQLGVVAGAFGFARMMTNIPAGLFVTHHPRRALVCAPVLMLAGMALVTSGGQGFAWLVLGQVLTGMGYTLANLASVTVILRSRAAQGLASTLNIFEFSAMLAVLSAVTLTGLLPKVLPWNIVFLIGCSPMLIGVAALRGVLNHVEPAAGAQPWFARIGTGASEPRGGTRSVVLLACAVGGTVALTYTTLASFLVPLRGSREFGLDRAGIAQLLMLVQVCDIVALLPVGALADARGTPRVLAAGLSTLAGAMALIGFGGLPHVVVGCGLFGLSMAGWNLPLALLRSATPASQVAWRTALYRVCVDGGMFLGPVLSGILAGTYPRLLPGVTMIVLALLAGALILARPARVG